MTVKERLEAYRRKKRKEKMMESFKNVFKNTFSWRRNDETEKVIEDSTNDEKVELCKTPQDIQDTDSDCWTDNVQESKSTAMTKVIYLLYFLLWITLYMIALEYEFGAVYFILSTLVFIWCNTRSGPKQRGEPSAYSVFNPNCEAIEGTLDASQFENEIRYGIGGMR